MKRKLTVFDRVQSSSSSKGVCANHTNKDGQTDNAKPPAGDIANEVDLLLLLVVSPEADTTEYEWPIERTAGIRVLASEARVVLQHKDLELGKLLQERDVLPWLILDLDGTVSEVMAAWHMIVVV